MILLSEPVLVKNPGTDREVYVDMDHNTVFSEVIEWCGRMGRHWWSRKPCGVCPGCAHMIRREWDEKVPEK